jgi:signal transduction histidine kinase
MRRRDAIATLVVGTLIVLALLAVFAIKLSDNQSRSRSDLETQAHQRAVLVAELIDGLFASAAMPNPQLQAEYGMPVVSQATLDRTRGRNLYVALMDANGRMLAASKGFTPQAWLQLSPKGPNVYTMIHRGQPWALGNVEPYGRSSVVDFATSIQTKSGERIVVTGIQPAFLSSFIHRELPKVPGVTGAHHYLLDGNGVVIASTNPQRPEGYLFHTPAQLDVLHHGSGTVNGHYFDRVPLANTTWRVLLAAPAGAFFASVSGASHWLPWVIFGAFALVALVALMLALRALRANELVIDANAKLAVSNAELERRARELARSNAELEQFASIASHDLQEPLRKVRTFAARVRETESESLSERGVDYLRRAEASAERMQRLIEDLLVFSRVATQTRPFIPVDLDQVVHEALEDLDDLIRRSGATVTVGKLPTVTADPPQMRQLMQNLMSNALKFRRQGVPPEVDISATVDAGTMTLIVRDNGIGFDQQYSRRIFRVFERLNGRGTYPGTGIGLSLCRKIVERHAGTIAAEGVAGAGSMFTVTLPVNGPVTDTDGPPTATNGDHAEQEEPYVAV